MSAGPHRRPRRRTTVATAIRPLGAGMRGATLIEVLVSLLVLSIGLLGVAALLSTGLRNNHSAQLRSQATVLAHDIADRMRANRQAALDGNYDTALADAITLSGGDPVSTVDLSEWKTLLATALPAGRGAISRNGSVVTITIEWDDSRGVGNALQFQTQTDL